MRRPGRGNSQGNACFDFAKGLCNRGDSCRFIHDANAGQTAAKTERKQESELPHIAYIWIDTSHQLATAMNELSRDKHVAVDTEFMTTNWDERRGTYGYTQFSPPLLCLVQLASESGKIFVVDVQRIERENLKPMWDLMENCAVEKIVHDCQEEGRIFRSYGVNCQNVFDTQVAAFYSGFPFDYGSGKSSNQPGLKKLVEYFIHLSLDKGEQKSNWMGILSESQRQYAASDVLFLHQIRHELNAKFPSDFVRQCFRQECSHKLEDRSDERRNPLDRIIGRQSWTPLEMARLKTLTKDLRGKLDERRIMEQARGDQIIPKMSAVDETQFVRGETPEEYRRNVYLFAVCQTLCVERGLPFECIGLRSSDMSFPDLIREMEKTGKKPESSALFAGWRDVVIGEPLFQLVVNKRPIEFQNQLSNKSF